MKAQPRAAIAAALLLGALPLSADEGKWMPQQIPALAERLRAIGFEGDPQAFADLTGQPMGAIVSLGGCTASFVSPDGLHRHQSPLRDRSAAVQLDPAAQPAGRRVPGEDARRGALERSRLEGLGHRVGQGRHAGDHRHARPEARRSPTLRRHRPADQAAHERVRGGRAALPRRVVLRGALVLRDRPARDPRRAPRLRARGGHRQLRRRGRQLALAAPHRRLVASIAPTSDRTASPRPTRRATCRTSRRAASSCSRRASRRATSSS